MPAPVPVLGAKGKRIRSEPGLRYSGPGWPSPAGWLASWLDYRECEKWGFKVILDTVNSDKIE